MSIVDRIRRRLSGEPPLAQVTLDPPEVIEMGGERYIRYDLAEREGRAPSRVEAWIIDGCPYWSEKQIAAAREKEA